MQGVCTALHLACDSSFVCPAFANQLPLLISDSLALSFILAGLLLKCRFLDLAVAKSWRARSTSLNLLSCTEGAFYASR